MTEQQVAQQIEALVAAHQRGDFEGPGSVIADIDADDATMQRIQDEVARRTGTKVKVVNAQGALVEMLDYMADAAREVPADATDVLSMSGVGFTRAMLTTMIDVFHDTVRLYRDAHQRCRVCKETTGAAGPECAHCVAAHLRFDDLLDTMYAAMCTAALWCETHGLTKELHEVFQSEEGFRFLVMHSQRMARRQAEATKKPRERGH